MKLEEIKKALEKGGFIALFEGEDGEIKFSGPYDRKKIDYKQFLKDNPEIAPIISKVIFVTRNYLVAHRSDLMSE